MDREISPRIRHRRLAARWLVGVAVLVLVGWAVAALAAWLRPSVHRQELTLGTVDRGPVVAVVQGSGTVRPTHERVIASPVEARVVRVLRRAGDQVAVGDPIVVLDTTATELAIARLEERRHSLASELEEARFEIEAQREELSSQTEVGRLDRELAEARLARTRKLFELGLSSAEALGEAEVEARKAALELSRRERALGTSERTSAARIARLERELEMVERELEAASGELERATRQCDTDGVIVWAVDQEGITLGRGAAIARVANLDDFHVEARFADIHAPRLEVGAAAAIELGSERLAGAVLSISPEISDGAVRLLVGLDDADAPALRQNQRVDVFVETGRRDEVVRSPAPSWSRGGELQELFVVDHDCLRRRRVRVGLVGRDHMEVLDGLTLGEEVVVSDLSRHQHMEVIPLD